MNAVAVIVGAVLVAISGALLCVALFGQALVRSGTVPREPAPELDESPAVRVAVFAFRTRRWSLLAFLVGLALIAFGAGLVGS